MRARDGGGTPSNTEAPSTNGGRMDTNIPKRWTLALVLAGSVAGGAVGGTLLSASPGSAATSTPATTTTATTTPPGAPSGAFHSNETAAHEAGESAAREAQENAGQAPTVP